MTSDEVTVGNTAPDPPASTAVSPASPLTDDDLTASCTPAADADGDALTYTYEWRKSSDGGSTWGAWGLGHRDDGGAGADLPGRPVDGAGACP